MAFRTPKTRQSRLLLFALLACMVCVVAVSIIKYVPFVAARGADYESDAHNRARSTAKAARAAHSHGISAALQLEGVMYPELSAMWFDAPSFVGPDRFAASETPLQVDASCAGRTELKHRSFEAAIKATVALDTTQSVPTDALVQHVSQFWQHDGWFYQMSARWDKDIPATYVIEHFRSQHSDFEKQVERIASPQEPNADILSVRAKIDSVVEQAEHGGARRGSRLVHVLLGGQEGDALQDLKIKNGRPIDWMLGHGRCRVNNDGNAFCRCVDATQATEQQKHEHSVID
jgi:hypothetical protein